MNIQWYPGHMARTKRELSENISGVDLVAEIIDARIPKSSRNPVLAELARDRRRIAVLNRCDLADKADTERWRSALADELGACIVCDSKTGRGCNLFAAEARKALSDKLSRLEAKGMSASLKIMVVGIPNVGKSSFINRVSGKKPAKAEDRPGVTRERRWYRLDNGLDLLDTPGMLWPKLDDEITGLHLAFTGAIRDEILDTCELALKLLECLKATAPGAIGARFGLDESNFEGAAELFDAVAGKRGLIMRGGEVDADRTASVLLDEFRSGKLGRITLEKCV